MIIQCILRYVDIHRHLAGERGGDEREMSIASDDIDDLIDITPDEEK